MEHPSYANRLPFEIWRECFMLLSVADHKALSKTCHFFRDISLAFILKSISCSSRLVFYKKHEAQHMTKQIQKMGRHMERFGELSEGLRAPLVRKCTLRYSLYLAAHTDEAVVKEAKGAYEEFVRSFVKFIPAFVNLRDVQIDFQGKNMDKKILAALAMIPDLDELSFHSVRFGVHLLKPGIKFRTLVIDNTNGSDSNPNPNSKLLDMFSGERLESLTVLSWSYAPKIFRALTKQDNSKCLSHLSFRLSSKDLQDLYPFLASCPNLESLHVDFGRREGFQPFSLAPIPRSTIPRLKSFSGPDVAAKAFIPGRPVKEVRLVSERWADSRNPAEMNGVFPFLVQSTGPVTELKIDNMDYGPEILNMIATQFQKLTKLQLNLATERIFIDEIPDARKLDKSAAEFSRRQNVDHRNDTKLPSFLHTVYLNILHWVALKRIDLPAGVETLYFNNYMLLLLFEEDSDEDDDNAPHGMSYTFPVALRVFDTLSIHYPALRNVVVGDVNGSGMKKLVWSKNMSSKWLYSETQ